MKFLQNMANFLATDKSVTGSEDFENVANSAYDAFLSIVNVVLPIILGVVLVFGLIYSIILGVNYARAEDSNARDEAKKRLIGAIVGIVVALVLMAIIWIILTQVDLSGLFEVTGRPGVDNPNDDKDASAIIGMISKLF